MSFLKKVVMAVFASKQQESQKMEIEMDNCSSYESFCYSLKSERSFLAPDVSDSSSDSDVFDFDDDSDEDIELTNDEQSCEVEESMDDFEIAFEESSDMTQFQRNTDPGWGETSINIDENRRSATGIGTDDYDWPNQEQSLSSATNELDEYIAKQSQRREFLKKINNEWDEAYKVDEHDKSMSKVSFAPDDSLTDVFPADICDRKGEWMMYAIDRMHFQRRIAETEAILSPCFSKENRSKVFFRFQINSEKGFCSDMK